MSAKTGKFNALWAVVVMFTLMLTVTACDIFNLGADTDDDPTSYHSERHYLIPNAESLDAGLPDRTESELIATINIGDMGAFRMALDSIPEQQNFVSITDDGYNKLESLSSPDNLYLLYDNGDIPETFRVGFKEKSDSSMNVIRMCDIKNPLYSLDSDRMPHMQIRYLFKKVSQAEIPYGTSQEVTNEWTQGVEISIAQSITETLSIETSVEVGVEWPLLSASASQSVKNEFSKTTTSKETVYGEESRSETVSFTPESEGTYIYATWQTVDVVEFVDKDGNPWDVSDLGWDFKRGLDNDGQNELFGFVSRVPLSVDKRITKDVFY